MSPPYIILEPLLELYKLITWLKIIKNSPFFESWTVTDYNRLNITDSAWKNIKNLKVLNIFNMLPP